MLNNAVTVRIKMIKKAAGFFFLSFIYLSSILLQSIPKYFGYRICSVFKTADRDHVNPIFCCICYWCISVQMIINRDGSLYTGFG